MNVEYGVFREAAFEIIGHSRRFRGIASQSEYGCTHGLEVLGLGVLAVREVDSLRRLAVR
jgi:hypothetical protein